MYVALLATVIGNWRQGDLTWKISMPHRNHTPAPLRDAGVRPSESGKNPSGRPFTFARSSAASEEHPERNEDYVIVDSTRGLAAVFDGVGGIAGGEIASRIAARTIHTEWKHLAQCPSNNHHEAVSEKGRADRQDVRLPSDAESDKAKIVQRFIERAHAEVRTRGPRRVRDRYGDVGVALTPKTTVALVALSKVDQSPGYSVVYAWVGDSRVYLLSADQALNRLTTDDGLLTELVRAGLLEEESARRVDQATQPWHLTRQERIFFERRNGITQALGDELTPAIHVKQATILPGDRLLLCSDGVHDNLIDKELETLLRQGARTTVARHIVEAAALQARRDIMEDMRSKPDDMSAVVITCHF
jgi:serine/threonine protein phosphatase PrpC